jgi:ATP-dependent RNA helicase RhlE
MQKRSFSRSNPNSSNWKSLNEQSPRLNPGSRQNQNTEENVKSESSKMPEGAFTSLISPLQRALAHEGYHAPTPIQAQTIPHLIEGRDLFGCAQTGTGKTAAFMLPILQYLAENEERIFRGQPRVLILAPTRELAAQIGDSITAYGRYLDIYHTVIFGGVNQNPQVNALNRGVDIVVATPGRLLDLIGQGHLSLRRVEVFVLDEADRMLDMGFIHDIRRVIEQLPEKRQSLFFSATMQPEVVELAKSMVHDPVNISIAPDKLEVERIEQKVFFVGKHDKPALLTSLLDDTELNKVIVFTKMKHVANKVARKLNSDGVSATAIHGDKSQQARTKALASFKRGKVRVLVATDIAARGIDVENITHVVNFDLPNEPETYIHRIGRTARAGAEGDAISFCSTEERDFLRDIERLIRKRVPVEAEHEFHSEAARYATGVAARPAPKQSFGAPRRTSNNNQRNFSQRSRPRMRRSSQAG